MNEGQTFGQILKRIIITAIVIGIAAFFTRGFTIDGLGVALTASVIIALLDYLVQKLIGVKASPFGRGFVGFVVTVAILLLTNKLVSGFNITLWSAIIGAIVIGILDMILPGGTL